MKKKNIIKTLISLAVVMAGMIFLLFQYNNNQTVQSLEKQLIIKSIDKSSEKYCWSVDYKNKMKSKKDSGYNVYAYGKVKKGKSTPLSLEFDEGNSDQFSLDFGYDFEKRNIIYDYSYSYDIDDETEVSQTYSINSQGKTGKLIKQEIKRGSKDKNTSTKKLLSKFNYLKKSVSRFEKQGITYDVLKKRVALDVQKAPKIAKDNEEKTKNHAKLILKKAANYQDQFENKLKKDGFSTRKFTKDDWLKYTYVRLQQLGIKPDSVKVIEDADKDNYSDTGRDYLNVVEQPRYHETEQINPLPNYKNPNDESFVEIKAKGELYVASFPENEWLFKESAVNDGIDHNTKTLGEIIPSQVDYLEYTEIDESELPQDIAPLSKILNQYIMKDKKPADDDIAHNIAIYALTKEPSHEGY